MSKKLKPQFDKVVVVMPNGKSVLLAQAELKPGLR